MQAVVAVASSIFVCISTFEDVFDKPSDHSAEIINDLQNIKDKLTTIEDQLKSLGEELKNVQVAIDTHVDQDFAHLIETEIGTDIRDFLDHYQALHRATELDPENETAG